MAKNNTTNSNQEDLQKQNEQLQQELAELRETMNAILEAQKEQPKQQVHVEEIDDEVSLIPPNKLINITSLFFGGMTLLGANNKQVRLERFGQTLPVTFEDLTYISSNHRRLAENGDFFIQSKDAVKALYLEENYKKIIDKKTIENLITLPDSEISNIYKNVTDDLKETIIDIVIDGVKKHLKDGDMKYSNRNKIEVLSQLSGKEIFKIANEAIENE